MPIFAGTSEQILMAASKPGGLQLAIATGRSVVIKPRHFAGPRLAPQAAVPAAHLLRCPQVPPPAGPGTLSVLPAIVAPRARRRPVAIRRRHRRLPRLTVVITLVCGWCGIRLLRLRAVERAETVRKATSYDASPSSNSSSSSRASGSRNCRIGLMPSAGSAGGTGANEYFP